ncbi:MAG: DNA primase [Spirochaetae bacterium HGW-Spirochaetae-3]|jgi:DNA primase|nr:MAG: DNA primase [Spirochaetae bacterium HGW-Spirochaetae-3]
MKRIPERIVQEIVSRSDIVKVVGEYVRLEKRGSRWTGLCPFHNERTPSFGVNEERGFFYCFGCKKGGDAITFIKEIEKCGYVEALEHLADKAGVVITYEGDEDPAEAKAAKDRESLYELYERLAGTFHHLLISDPRGTEALDYVRRRRLSDQTLVDFRLGYVPKDRAWLFRFLRAKSYSVEFLSKSGLFSGKYPESSIFSDRLIFPISDVRGRVVAFGGRLLSGDGPKYINSPETLIFKKHETLFGLSKAAQAMRTSGEAILCEGYMDTIAFHAAGVANAVAPLGTSFTESQAALLKRYAATLILSFDSDDAGVKATERAMGIAENVGLAVRVLRIAGAKDPAEILEKNGPERLKINAASTITSDDFVLGNAASMLRAGDSESQSEAFGYLFPFIADVSSEIRRDAFINAAATRLGADPASVRSDYSRFLNKGSPKRTIARETASSGFVPSADAELIAAIVANSELFESARSEIGYIDFDEEPLKDAFITMEECYRSGDQSVAAITGRLTSEGLKEFILQKISDGAYSINPERFVIDGVRRVKERTLEQQNQRLVARIREYDPDRDGDELSLNDLLYEKMYVDGELTRIKEERHGRP